MTVITKLYHVLISQLLLCHHKELWIIEISCDGPVTYPWRSRDGQKGNVCDDHRGCLTVNFFLPAP